MILTELKINNFRNYNNAKIKLSNGINIIYGDNGQGKTNLLESIYVLALTKSHRTYIDNNLIRMNCLKSKVEGTLLKNEIKTKLCIELIENNKNLYIDLNKETKVQDYISNMNIIFFYPEDLELVKGNPIIRRKYINTQLCQLLSNYMVLLNDYNKLIKIKNKFLKTKQYLSESDKQYYKILNDHIVNKAVSIYLFRNKYIDKINNYSEEIYFNLTGIKGFNIKYKPLINVTNSKNDIIETMKNELSKKENDEFRLKKSLVGPHLDDFDFYIEEKNLKLYGSQGQQRMAVLALKLSEVEIFKEYKNSYPILLLDDVFSELDNKKKNLLLKYINNNIQSIITTTDLKNINKKTLDNSKLFKISNGNIIKEVEKNERK